MVKLVHLLLVTLSAFSLSAQTVYENPFFGFKFKTSQDWRKVELIELDTLENKCSYTFRLSNNDRVISALDNRIVIRAQADGFANSIAEVHLLERQSLHRRYRDLSVVRESEKELLVEASIEGEKYNILTLVEYRNGIGYIVSYSYPLEKPHAEQISLEAFMSNIDFTEPKVSYEDLHHKIRANPEDSTLLFIKAKRKFDFHNFKEALDEFSFLISKNPNYGKAYYYRGHSYLILGKKLEACMDFDVSYTLSHLGGFDFSEHCNTREISEALRKKHAPKANPFQEVNPNANPLLYVDSIKNHKYILMSSQGPPSKEVVAYVNQLNYLFELGFSQLDSIYSHEKGILQLYSFGAICTKYPDKINRKHKEMLKIKGETMVLNRDQKDPYLKPTKEIASMMYDVVESIEKEKKLKIKTEKAVKSFIRKYAMHKDSYIPISFHEFRVSKTVEGDNLKTVKKSQTYIIGHSYKIKDVNGDTAEAYHTFKFKHDFKVNIIEQEESNTFSSYPPKVTSWLEKYGSPLRKRDKKRLGLPD